VTLTFDLLTLVSRHTWRVTWSTPPPSLKILRLSVLELWVLTSPIGYHWQEKAGHLEARFQGSSPTNILIPLERQLNVLQLCRWQFLYNETLQQTFRPSLLKSSKIRPLRHFDPHFEKAGGGVEPWWMARWKALAEFFLSVIELLFLSLTVEALQGKTCQNSQTSGGWVSLSQDFRGKGSPLSICWYHPKGNWLHYNFAADSFYIMKLCNKPLVLYCRNCLKDDKFRYLIPILRKLGAA